MLEYRSFSSKVFFDVNTKSYYGWAAHAQHVVSFQAASKLDLGLAMQAAVHNLLEYWINQATEL